MAKQAPGSLGLVQDFVNTHDTEVAKDELATPEALRAWLTGRELLSGGSLTAADQASAVRLREALRRLLAANNDGSTPPEADLALLNEVAVACRLHPRFGPGPSVRLEPSAEGLPGALGRVAAAAAEAMNDGTWHRLKVCADDRCQWAFYDQSKNRSGHWCSMEVCGNRTKARQFRERRRAGASRRDG